jgi:hypothetical protein
MSIWGWKLDADGDLQGEENSLHRLHAWSHDTLDTFLELTFTIQFGS